MDRSGEDHQADLPDVIDHFRPLARIGSGGMGIVYLASDLNIPGRQVAVKVLRTEDVNRSLGELRQEAATLAALQHPNIVTVHEIGNAPHGPFLAMEHLEGGSLRDRIAKGPIPLPSALGMAREAARALAIAHSKGIVHCDVKPANLLLTSDGHVKVADFGLAARVLRAPSVEDVSHLETEPVVTKIPQRIGGTPGYMAPELFAGSPSTPLTDQFAFGVTLHETLAGRHPFEDVAWTAVMSGTSARIDPSLPSDLRRIIMRCMQADAGGRYGSMEEVVGALDAAITRRDPLRRRFRMWASAVVALLLLGGALWIGSRWVARRQAIRLNEMGAAAFSSGHLEEAFLYFSRAHSLDPASGASCANLGMLSLEETNVRRAVTILQECKEAFPDSPAVLAGLGRALRDSGDSAGAVGVLRRALESGPAPELELLTANELALTLIDQGEMAAAAAVIAERKLPGRNTLEGAVLRKTLGLALVGAGRSQEAARVLGEALEGPLTGDSRGRALIGLGRSLEAQGDRAGARKAFSRAILEAPGTPAEAEAQEGLERLSGDGPSLP